MKKAFLGIALISLLVGLYKIETAYAGLIYRPFGGTVLLAPSPEATCAGYGPITIKPVTIGLSSNLSVGLTNLRFLTNPVHPAIWILGMYSLIPNTTNCYTSSGEPYTTFPIKIYGVSKTI